MYARSYYDDNVAAFELSQAQDLNSSCFGMLSCIAYVAVVSFCIVELHSLCLQHSNLTVSSAAKLCLQKWRKLLVSGGS